MKNQDKANLIELRTYLRKYFKENQLSTLDLRVTKNHKDSTFDVSVKLNTGLNPSSSSV